MNDNNAAGVIRLWFANWRDIGKVNPSLEVAIDSLEGTVDELLDSIVSPPTGDEREALRASDIENFTHGAEFIAGRLPGRDEIAQELANRREPEYRDIDPQDMGDADAVLALITERIGGGSGEH